MSSSFPNSRPLRWFAEVLITHSHISHSSPISKHHTSLLTFVKHLVCNSHLMPYLTQTLHPICAPTIVFYICPAGPLRKIRRSTARAMLTWSHYTFREYLIFKAQEFPWVKVHLCTEEYTSKTCTFCGWIKHNLGGNKVFRCPNPGCLCVFDRDINGARNIFLKCCSELNVRYR